MRAAEDIRVHTSDTPGGARATCEGTTIDLPRGTQADALRALAAVLRIGGAWVRYDAPDGTATWRVASVVTTTPKRRGPPPKVRPPTEPATPARYAPRYKQAVDAHLVATADPTDSADRMNTADIYKLLIAEGCFRKVTHSDKLGIGSALFAIGAKPKALNESRAWSVRPRNVRVSWGGPQLAASAGAFTAEVSDAPK